MLFALGYIAGLVTAAFVFAVLAFFKSPIERTLSTVSKQVSLAGPRPTGFIFEPVSEVDEMRKAHIEENAERGQDTPIDQLR